MSAKPVYLLDTNVLLRFLLNDHPAHGQAARKLFADAEAGKLTLSVPFIAVTEAVFTLQSHYQVDRSDIGRELFKLLTAPGVKLACPAWILQALEDFRTRNVSFGGACIAAEAGAGQHAVASFDRGLDKFPGLKRHDPKV